MEKKYYTSFNILIASIFLLVISAKILEISFLFFLARNILMVLMSYKLALMINHFGEEDEASN